MNVTDFVRKFSHREILINDTAPSPRIVVPLDIFDHTISLCGKFEETTGFMFFVRDTNKEFFIQCMIETSGERSAWKVEHEHKLFEAAKRLIRENPELGFVEFHTHTWHTGSSFYESFSGSDFTVLKKKVGSMQNYKHVLFTPTHVLTWGLEKPTFVVLKKRAVVLEEQTTMWKRKFNEIVRSM